MKSHQQLRSSWQRITVGRWRKVFLSPWQVDHAPGHAPHWRVFEEHRWSGWVLRQAGGRVVSVSEGMNLRELGGWSLHRIKIGFVGIFHLSTDMCFHICSIRIFLHILQLYFWHRDIYDLCDCYVSGRRNLVTQFQRVWGFAPCGIFFELRFTFAANNIPNPVFL